MLLNDLFERKLTPGERQGINIKLDKYKKALRDLERHQQAYNSMDAVVIPGTEQHLEELKAEYKKIIDKLQAIVDSDKSNNALEKFMAGIVKNCPTFIKAFKTTDRLLYRGTRESATAFYGKPYDERNSKDSEGDLSKAFNDALKKAGAVARRDNSVFTTTSRNLASLFGHTLYLIFPRDPVHYTWSDKEKDLVLNSEHMDKMADPNVVKELMRVVWTNDELRNDFIAMYSKELWINAGTEIHFDVDNYPKSAGSFSPFQAHNFRTSFRTLSMLLPKMGEQYTKYHDFENWVTPEAVINNYGIHIDEGLNAALRRGWEITVHAEYYAIRSDYEQQVRKLLGMSEYAGERDIGDDPPDDEGY
jgi:hypothetical protein